MSGNQRKSEIFKSLKGYNSIKNEYMYLIKI